MPRRMTLVAATLIAFGLSWSGIRAALSQQDNEPKQTLIIGYPTQGIIVDGTGPTAVRYKGVIYVKIYPVGANLVRKYGAGPFASAELGPSQRDVRQLPLGEYEVHFSMRNGSELKTYILRDVILRADRANGIVVEMNSAAKTTVIGGDMTAQQMADSIRQLQQQVAELKQKLAGLKQG